MAGRCADRVEDVRFVRVYDHSVDHHLVEDEVGFFDVEHDVEFADVLEVLIQRFHERVDEFEQRKFVLQNRIVSA